ncbi:hypothetical protein PUN28_007834 [Cardiocondyla obscurior]|uniref:Transmembrane protein n=1 Tax=Cardiocondyla obscurior TaxID=286306 RepID=A0AAW2FUL0_9HYME
MQKNALFITFFSDRRFANIRNSIATQRVREMLRDGPVTFLRSCLLSLSFFLPPFFSCFPFLFFFFFFPLFDARALPFTCARFTAIRGKGY